MVEGEEELEVNQHYSVLVRLLRTPHRNPWNEASNIRGGLERRRCA
jgi:hypothetical protein